MSKPLHVKELRQALSPYAVPDTRKGLTLFTTDIALYAAAIAVVLFAPWMLLKVLASILAGAKIANLATLAHDAAHNSLTASRRLNKWLGIIAFTPSLINYRMWVYDHHVLHHPNTNGDHPDSYLPLSKAEYDALPAWRRFLYRMSRSETIWFMGVYSFAVRWWQAKSWPRKTVPPVMRAKAWRHVAYLVLYLGGYLALLAAAPLYSSTGAPVAILLGLALPLYVFHVLFGFTLYVQHTNPRVAWFKEKADREIAGRPDQVTIHLRVPKLMSTLTHHVYDHAAHHVAPAIPCYRLPEAQDRLDELSGPNASVEDFSLAWLRDVQRRCKLYDFDRHRWTDFEGNPTSESTLRPA